MLSIPVKYERKKKKIDSTEQWHVFGPGEQLGEEMQEQICSDRESGGGGDNCSVEHFGGGEISNFLY